jgi:hypothetical protein
MERDIEAAVWFALGAKGGDWSSRNHLDWRTQTGTDPKEDLNQQERGYLASAQEGYGVAVNHRQLLQDEQARLRKP